MIPVTSDLLHHSFILSPSAGRRLPRAGAKLVLLTVVPPALRTVPGIVGAQLVV